MTSTHLLAAVDLGSNSFRLEMGRESQGRIGRVEYLKETVRLGAGLDAKHNLNAQAMQTGWDCLARFGERLRDFKPRLVRAVATQTLREAQNREEFLAQARRLLGFPIEVISGPEEARLIYLGVAQLLPPSAQRRLVIDIGGRSTEIILGCQLHAGVMVSCQVGSVAWSMQFFPAGELSPDAFDRARMAAQAILGQSLSQYPRSAWEVAYGSSGTIGAVADVLGKSGWPVGVIDRAGLAWLKRRMILFGHTEQLQFEGLKEDRRPIFGGGVSVLDAVMDLLDIDQLRVAQGALRHGVLYDLLARETPAGAVRHPS